jgi:hypothetical protein
MALLRKKHTAAKVKSLVQNIPPASATPVPSSMAKPASGPTKPGNLSFVESRSASIDFSIDDFEGPDSGRDPRTSLIDPVMCKRIGR